MNTICLSLFEALRENAPLNEIVKAFEAALEKDYDNSEVLNALKCSVFWLERESRLDDFLNDYERGIYLFQQWASFIQFTTRFQDISFSCLESFKVNIFTKAKLFFENYQKENIQQDVDLLLYLERCNKKLGNYSRCVYYSEEAYKIQNENSEVIAELADSYALVNEIRLAKVYFREAFFINPKKIKILQLESLIIVRLIEKLHEVGYNSPELEEWLPIYANIWGIFNIKRELRPIDNTKIQQLIYSLENTYLECPEERWWAAPRLINKYFWIIDHLILQKSDKKKLDEILLKIKALDPEIFKLFTNQE